MRGFTPGTATNCASGWSTRVGASSLPPAPPLPDYLGVIVTSTIKETNVTITGDTKHLDVVKTNPGYLPDPGHKGTGKVVAVIQCE